MKMKNKKGLLVLKTAINVVVALAVIIVLIYFAVQLFGIFTDFNDFEKAEAHMDEIELIIEGLEDGESEKYLLISPNGWSLTGWPSEGFIAEGNLFTLFVFFTDEIPVDYKGEIPQYCLDKGWEQCLCLCEKKSNRDNFLDTCNELSVCIPLDKEVFINKDKNADTNSFIPVISEITIMFEEGKLKIFEK